MRVCQIIESTSGGSVRVALDLTHYLLATGVDVTFIYSPLRADQHFLDEMKAIKNAKFIPVKMHRSVGLHDLVSGLKLYKTLKKEGPFDVVHAHSSKAGGLSRLVSLFLPKFLRIYTPHAFITMSPGASSLYCIAERILSKLSDAIITVSQAEKDHAVDKIKINPDLMHVVPNGIAFVKKVSRKEACHSVGLSSDNFIIGYVGRMVSQKNPLRLIKSFIHIRQQKPNAKLVMIGNGELLEDVQAAVLKSGLGDHVVFCTNHQAREIIPAFDVLCCSSDYEGIPLVFLEALSAGVPVVTTPVGGTQEAIIPGKTGFVAEKFTPQSLAIAVMRIGTQGPIEKAQMQNQAFDHGAIFTVKRMGSTVRQIYHDLMQKTGMEKSAHDPA